MTIAVVGGAVWRAYDTGVFSVGEGPAYEPWKDWRTESHDGPLALVRAAILGVQSVQHATVALQGLLLADRGVCGQRTQYRRIRSLST